MHVCHIDFSTAVVILIIVDVEQRFERFFVDLRLNSPIRLGHCSLPVYSLAKDATSLRIINTEYAVTKDATSLRIITRIYSVTKNATCLRMTTRIYSVIKDATSLRITLLYPASNSAVVFGVPTFVPGSVRLEPLYHMYLFQLFLIRFCKVC